MTTKPFWPRIALTGTTLSCLLVASVQAHENHDHSRSESIDTESKAPIAADLPASLDEIKTETDAVGSIVSTEEPQAIEAVQPLPATPSAASVTQAGVLTPGTIGLNESLLGLIIAAPFLLVSLKKRLQS